MIVMIAKYSMYTYQRQKYFKNTLTYLWSSDIIGFVYEIKCSDRGLVIGPIAQLVRALACHARGRGFESLLDRWELSSAGRAPALQAGGHRFEPCSSHFYVQK